METLSVVIKRKRILRFRPQKILLLKFDVESIIWFKYVSFSCDYVLRRFKTSILRRIFLDDFRYLKKRLNQTITWDFKITFAILIFFRKFFLTMWKSSSSRSRKPVSKVSKLNTRFFKNCSMAKNGPKTAILFLCFLGLQEF